MGKIIVGGGGKTAPATKPKTASPSAADLAAVGSAGATSLSHADRMGVMMRVSAGELSVDEAIQVLKNLETDTLKAAGAGGTAAKTPASSTSRATTAAATFSTTAAASSSTTTTTTTTTTAVPPTGGAKPKRNRSRAKAYAAEQGPSLRRTVHRKAYTPSKSRASPKVGPAAVIFTATATSSPVTKAAVVVAPPSSAPDAERKRKGSAAKTAYVEPGSTRRHSSPRKSTSTSSFTHATPKTAAASKAAALSPTRGVPSPTTAARPDAVFEEAGGSNEDDTDGDDDAGDPAGVDAGDHTALEGSFLSPVTSPLFQRPTTPADFRVILDAIPALQSVSADSQDRITATEAEVSEAKEANAGTADAVATLSTAVKSANDELKAGLEREAGERASLGQALQDGLASGLAAAATEAAALKEQLASMVTGNAAAIANNAATSTKLDSALKSLVGQIARTASGASDGLAAAVAELRAEIAAASEKITAAAAAATSAKEDAARDLAMLRADFEALKAAKEIEASTSADLLSKGSEAMITQVRTAQSDAAAEAAKLKLLLESEIAAVRSDMEANVGHLKTTLAASDAENAELKAEVSELRTMLESRSVVPVAALSAPSPAPKAKVPPPVAKNPSKKQKSKKSKKSKVSAEDIGCRVTVAEYSCEGTLRFVGLHAESGKPRCGVELDEPLGKNNGTVKGTTYFECPDEHGVLTKPDKVIIIGPPVEELEPTDDDDLNPFASPEPAADGNPFDDDEEEGNPFGDTDDPVAPAGEEDGNPFADDEEEGNPFGDTDEPVAAEEDGNPFGDDDEEGN
eukprot:gene6060-18469_t